VYVFVYSVDGTVTLTLEYEECGQSGQPCKWETVGPPGGLRVMADELGALNKTTDSINNRYRYSVKPDSANTQYHVSGFDVNEYDHEMCTLKNGEDPSA